MKSRRLNFVAFIGLVGLVAALVTSAPAAQAPFYEGKTLRVLIASGPGGGTDTAGRLVARYLLKYLPGNPKIVTRTWAAAVAPLPTTTSPAKSNRMV